MPTIHVPYTLMARQRPRHPLLLALILLILLVTGCVDDDTQDTMAPQDTTAPKTPRRPKPASPSQGLPRSQLPRNSPCAGRPRTSAALPA